MEWGAQIEGVEVAEGGLGRGALWDRGRCLANIIGPATRPEDGHHDHKKHPDLSFCHGTPVLSQ